MARKSVKGEKGVKHEASEPKVTGALGGEVSASVTAALEGVRAMPTPKSEKAEPHRYSLLVPADLDAAIEREVVRQRTTTSEYLRQVLYAAVGLSNVVVPAPEAKGVWSPLVWSGLEEMGTLLGLTPDGVVRMIVTKYLATELLESRRVAEALHKALHPPPLSPSSSTDVSRP